MSDRSPASPTAPSSASSAPPWVRPREAAALAFVGSWAGYFLFTGMPQLTLHVFPRTVVFHAMAGGMVLLLLVALAVTRRLPGGTPLDAGVLAVAGAFAVATWTSVAWRPSLEATLQLSVAAVTFYALCALPWLSATSLRRALMLTCGALALYALWVVGNDYAEYLALARRVDGLSMSNIFPPTVPRVHDVSDHPNVLAMLLALVLPLFALGALRRDAWERTLGVAGLLAGGMAIFLTLSRGAWAGAAVGVAFTVAGVWLTQRLYEREARGERASWADLVPAGFSPTAVAAVLGALALLVGGTLAFVASSSARPGWLFRSSLSPREDAWRAGWHMLLDHPWTGVGPNSFGLLYPQYARGDFLVYTQHAHNGFLQFADDAGLLGLAALAVLAAATAFCLWRTWRRGSLEQRLLAVACAGGLLAFSVHNQVDAGNIWKAPAIALAFLGAIIARNYRETARGGAADAAARASAWRRRTLRALAGGGVLLLLVAPLALWYRIDRAHYDYWRGVEAANKAEPDPARWLQRAVDADSSMMVYHLQLGQVLATQYELSRDRPREVITRAVVHLERAAALDPRSDLAHADLARAYALAGNDIAAAREAQRTRFIARYHVPPVLAAGEVYEMIGRTADAIDTYAQAISMDAGLADSAYWQETPFRRQHFAEVLRRSALGINPCTEGAYLVQAHRSAPAVSLAGLPAASNGCQLLVFARPDDLVLRVNFARILEQQGRTADALGHLRFAIARQPDFGPARTELGRWYQASGDLAEARHQWVIGGQLGEPESVILLGDSYPAGQRPAGLTDRLAALLRTTGSSVQNDVYSVLYYRMRYARLSPVLAMVPGDWQTAVPRPYAEMAQTLARWQSGQ